MHTDSIRFCNDHMGDIMTQFPLQISGFRKSTPHNRRAQEISKQWNGLYDVGLRWEVVHLLKSVGHQLGFKRHHVAHLEWIVSQVSAKWWEPGFHPYFWMAVNKQAEILCLSERTIRDRENDLIALGAVAFNGSANGRRYAEYDDHKNLVSAYGLDLAPMMTLLPELRALEEKRKQELNVKKTIRSEIQAIRQRCHALINEAISLELQDWEVLAQELEPHLGRIEVGLSLEDLFTTKEQLLILEKTCLEFIQSQTSADCGETGDTAATAEVDRRHIENTTDPRTSKGSIYNPHGDKAERRSLRSQVGVSVQADACHAQGCLQGETGGGAKIGQLINDAYLDPASLTGAVHITPPMAAFAASSRVRSKLPTERLPVQEDIIMAAMELLAEIGIARHAWDRGVAKIGAYPTALAFVLVDAKYREMEGVPDWTAGEYFGGIVKKTPKAINLHRSYFKRLKEMNYFNEYGVEDDPQTHLGDYGVMPPKEGYN